MYSKVSDEIKFLAGDSSVDITAGGGLTTPYVAIATARKLLALIAFDALAATKTLTVQFMQATSTAGAGAKTLDAAFVYTSPAGGLANGTFYADAECNDLDDAHGFDFVAVNVTSNAAVACKASATLVAGSDRYNP
jgi:hypothetical protein